MSVQEILVGEQLSWTFWEAKTVWAAAGFREILGDVEVSERTVKEMLVMHLIPPKYLHPSWDILNQEYTILVPEWILIILSVPQERKNKDYLVHF